MISITPISDKKAWEDFLLNYEKGSERPLGGIFLQSWGWGQFQKNLGRNPERLGIYDKNELVGICLLYIQKPKTGAFAYVPAGPVFSKWDKKYVEAWKDYITKLVRGENASFLRIEPRVVTENTAKVLKQAGFIKAPTYTQPKCSAIFDLKRSEDELLQLASSSTRYNIRSSQRKGVKVLEGAKDEVEVFVKLLSETTKRKSLDLPVEKDYHKLQYETLEKEGLMKLYIAESKGEALSAALVLFYGQTAYYIHAANSLKRKGLRASYPLVWHSVQEARKKDFRWFDFWGVADSEDPKDPWAGVTSFKLSFGSNRVCFDPVFDLPLKGTYLLTKTLETWRKPIKKITRFR